MSLRQFKTRLMGQDRELWRPLQSVLDLFEAAAKSRLLRELQAMMQSRSIVVAVSAVVELRLEAAATSCLLQILQTPPPSL